MGFIRRLDFFDRVAILLSFLFVLAGNIVSIGRFWQYEAFYYDFGIYDRAIWEVAHFRPPVIDHFIVGGKLIFADHFAPAIFLLSPLYWVTDRSEVLFIVQALAVGLSGIVVYLIGIEVLKSKFGSLTILVSYFLFLGLQNAVITDFHELTIATLPLSLVFYAIIKKNLKLYIISLLLTILLKETLFIMCTALGLFIVIFSRSWRWVGIATILFSVIYGLSVIKFVIPYFSKGLYVYSETLIYDPVYVLKTLVDNPVKIQTMFNSFFSFGFLPIFSPAFWILIFQDFLVRFYAPGTTRITLGFHYNAPLSVIMAVASFYGLKNLKRLISKDLYKFIPIIIILISIYLYRFILHGPFALSYNGDFYKHSDDFQFLNELVKKVPVNASVVTQNNIAPHFTHNKNIFILRMNYEIFKADYIVIDARSGQNPNNFFGAADFNIERFLQKVTEDKNYKTIYKTDYQYIFRRI